MSIIEKDIFSVNLKKEDLNSSDAWGFLGSDIKLIIGFVSPDLDFSRTAAVIAGKCGSLPLILTSTAGELCNLSLDEKQPLYHTSREDRGNIVLQCYRGSVVADVDIHSIDLFDSDLKADERVKLIGREFASLSPAFPLRYDNCVAFTLIDGLSGGESFFMEAAYQSGKLPCLIIGGSAGGKLDFENTYLYDGGKVVQNRAVVTLIRFREDIRLGVFKSQNFKKSSYSFTVAQADPVKRTVRSVVREDTGEISEAIEELCRYFQCPEGELEEKLTHYSFAIVIDGDLYVRSIAGIDFASRDISFYCDLDFGDELFLVEHTDFVASLEADWRAFGTGKEGVLLGGLFNDCILRRLFNQDNLGRVTCFDSVPVAGFSTFGELLGVNINQTLTALMFYRVSPGDRFYDEYLDNYIQKYSAFKEFFIKRKMNQLHHVMDIKNRVWDTSMESISLLSGVIETSSQRAAENEKVLAEINGNFAVLLDSIDESDREGMSMGEELEKLEKYAERVEEILGHIVDIAGQTSILGFNASIEAARAGQAGRGFAIIAREVKSLSDKTDSSVRDSRDSITGLISSLEKLRNQSRTITESQNNARSHSHTLKEEMQLLADNSRKIERSISENVAEIQQMKANLSRMTELIDLISRDNVMHN